MAEAKVLYAFPMPSAPNPDILLRGATLEQYNALKQTEATLGPDARTTSHAGIRYIELTPERAREYFLSDPEHARVLANYAREQIDRLENHAPRVADVMVKLAELGAIGINADDSEDAQLTPRQLMDRNVAECTELAQRYKETVAWLSELEAESMLSSVSSAADQLRL